jgi:hypothetical protein
MAGEFGNPEVVEEEVDILLIGGGMACCGAGYEIMRWIEAAKAESESLSFIDDLVPAEASPLTLG